MSRRAAKEFGRHSAASCPAFRLLYDRARMAARRWTIYILRCCDGSLYTGITTRLEARLAAHRDARRGARYTRSRLPVEVVFRSGRKTGTEARKLEVAVKALTRAEKLRLVAGSRRLWRRLRLEALGSSRQPAYRSADG